MKHFYSFLISAFLCINFTAFSQQVSSNSPICLGNSLELKASSGKTFVWKGPNGFTSSQQNPIIEKTTLDNAGSYSVTIDGTTTLSVDIKVGKAYFGSIGIYHYVTGNELAFSTYPSSATNGAFTYSWVGPNNFTSQVPFPSISGFDKKAQGVYTETMSDEFGCTYSASTTVTFKNPDCPYVTSIYVENGNSSNYYDYFYENSIRNINICKGIPTTLRVDTAYLGKCQIQWFKNDQLLSGVNDVKLQISDDAIFYAKITNSKCEYLTTKLNVLNITSPKVTITSNTNEKTISICKNQGDVYLNVSSEYLSNSNYTYQWLKDDKVIDNAVGWAYLAGEEGEYKVIGKAGSCVGISEPIKIVNADKISAKLSFRGNDFNSTSGTTADISEIRELKVCKIIPIQFNLVSQAIGTQEIYLNNQLFRTISKYSQNDNRTYINQSGIYKLKVTQGKCIAEDSVKITEGKTFTIPLFQTTTLPVYYNNDNYPVINTYIYPEYNYWSLPNNGFQWYKDDELYRQELSITPTESGNYQLKYKDSKSECVGESRIVKIDKPLAEQKFTINSPKTTILCEGASHTLAATTCYQDYSSTIVWKKDGKIIPKSEYCQINVKEAGKYWYELNRESRIYYSDTVEVKIEKALTLSLKDSCLANNTLALVANKITDADYMWYRDNQLIKDATTSTIIINQYGNYYLQVIKNNCTYLSKEITSGVSAFPIAQRVCMNDSIIFSPKGSLKMAEWTGPNNFYANILNPKIPKATKAMSGIYTLKAETNSGCSISIQSRVIVDEVLTMNLQKTLFACEGSDFLFPSPTSTLTDSTETVDYYIVTYPNGNKFTISPSNIYKPDYLPLFRNISSKNAGTYKVEGFSYRVGCSVKETTQLSVLNSADCKSITLGNLNPKYLTTGICVNDEIEIPFTTTGTFTVGTKFKVITTGNVVLGEGTKSPIKIKAPQTGFSSFEIRVISEDKTLSSLKANIILKAGPLDYEFLGDWLYSYETYISENSIIACDSARIFCYGENIKNFQWFRDNVRIPSADTYELQAKQDGSYKVKFETKYGCIWETTPIKVTLRKFPKPVISGSNQFSCGQETIDINVASPNGNITWKRDGILLEGKISKTLQTNQTGKYVATIQKDQCFAVSDTFEITKSTSNSKFNAKVSYQYTPVGCSKFKANLYAVSDYSSKKLNYQWFKDGIKIPNANDANFTTTENGKYSVKISNGTCEGFSNEIILNRPPVLKISYSGNYNNGETEYCEGSNISLSVYNHLPTSISSVSTNDTSQTNFKLVKNTIQWYRDGKQINSIESPSKEYGVYLKNDYDYISFYSHDGKNIYDSYFESKKPGKYFTIFKTLYENGEECVSSTDTLDIKFSKQVPLLKDYAYDENLKYIPIVSCRDSVTIQGNATSTSANNYYGPVNNQRAIGYTWKKDGQIIKSLNKNEIYQNITTNQEGTYVLETQYKGGCVSISKPYKVSLGKLSVSMYSGTAYDNNICEGEKITFNGFVSSSVSDTNKIVYKWTKDGAILNNLSYLTTSKSGSYQLKASRGKCEGASETINVNVVQIPTSIIPKDSVAFCDNSTVELTASNESGLKYQWELNNTGIKNANDVKLKTNTPGIYRALLRKGECWDYSEKVKTVSLPTILPKAILKGDQSIEYDKETKLSISLNSYAPWSLKLSDGQEFTTSVSPFEINVKPQVSTTYTISEVKNICGIGTTEGSAKIEVLILANETEKDINVEVYPIPASEICNWKISTDKPEKVHLTLYDLFGKNILEQVSENRSQNHSGVIDLSKINAGTYFLKIEVGNKNITRKIIKY